MFMVTMGLCEYILSDIDDDHLVNDCYNHDTCEISTIYDNIVISPNPKCNIINNAINQENMSLRQQSDYTTSAETPEITFD